MTTEAEVKTEMAWRPIETAPLPKFSRRHWDRRFTCLVASHKGVELGVFSYTGTGVGVWSGYSSGPSHRVQPTHWMPLPAPPSHRTTMNGEQPVVLFDIGPMLCRSQDLEAVE